MPGFCKILFSSWDILKNKKIQGFYMLTNIVSHVFQELKKVLKSQTQSFKLYQVLFILKKSSACDDVFLTFPLLMYSTPLIK